MNNAEFLENSRLVFFFRGQAPIFIDHNIEISGIRFSLIEKKWEAKDIVDATSGVIYKSEDGMILYELGWKDKLIKGVVKGTTIVGSKRTVIEIIVTV